MPPNAPTGSSGASRALAQPLDPARPSSPTEPQPAPGPVAYLYDRPLRRPASRDSPAVGPAGPFSSRPPEL